MLIEDRTTETDQTWANPDGSLTTENALAVVRKRRADGRWADVDLTLQRGPAGVTPAVPAVPMTFGGAGSSTVASTTIKGAPVAVGWEAPLPEPVLSGTVALYPEVRPGIDLKVEALRTGFEVSWVVKSKPAGPLSLPLTLVTTGLSVVRDADGSLALADAAGTVVSRGQSPVMFGAAKDVQTNLPSKSRAVANSLSAATQKGDGSSSRVWTMSPDTTFFTDPTVAYPVLVDPSYTFNVSADTYVKTDVATSQYNATRLYIGINGASQKARTFLHVESLPTSVLSGKYIDSASLQLFNSYSGTCTDSLAMVQLGRVAPWSAGMTWSGVSPNNQPTYLGTLSTQYWAHAGWQGTCNPATYDNLDMRTMVQAWADGSSTTKDFRVVSSETLTSGWKEFYSGDAGSNPPKITFTYRAYPVASTPAITPVIGGGSGGYWSRTTTPTFSDKVTSATGSTVQARFSVWQGTTQVGTSFLGNSIAAGGTSTATAPASLNLQPGIAYRLEVEGVSGGAVSQAATPPSLTFTIDQTAPAQPSISSTDYPASTWQSGNPAGSFTFASPGHTDVQTWAYRFDGGTFTNVPGNVGTTDSSTTVSITPPQGWQSLHVVPVDRAGNRGTEQTYSFGAGAALTAPADGAMTQQQVKLAAIAASGSNQVSFSYRFPDQTGWTPVPTGATGAVSYTDLTPVTSWPVTASASGASVVSPTLLLDVAKLLTPSGGSAQDGTVQLRAEFANSGTPTVTTQQLVTVGLDRNAFGDSYATEQVGPGTVSLLTGNYSVSSTDASVTSYGSDLTLSRTFNSRTPSSAGLFGPGWTPSLSVDETGSDFTTLVDLGGTVTLTSGDGSLLEFRFDGTDYIGQGDAEGLTLTAGANLGSAPGSFTLLDEDGNQTVFSVTSNWSEAAGLATPHAYPPTSVIQPGSSQTTSYTYSSGRPVRMLAPVPAGVTCPAYPSAFSGAANMGCRALDLTYATVNGQQQIVAATERTTDGAGTSVNVALACYAYGSNGRLSQAWDPRINGTTCSSTPAASDLPTGYSYNSDGRLATLTPPGLAAWTLGYDSTGRFTSAARTHDTQHGGGTETSTVVYEVPFGNDTDAATGLHPDLSQATVGTWAQTDLVTDATAVFGPGDTVPTLPVDAGDDFRDGTVHAMNVTGRQVNTAVFSGTGQAGWKISTTEYDDAGRVLRSLTAGNRDRALGRAAAEDVSVDLPADTAAAALMLDSTSLYALNPHDTTPETGSQLDLVDTFGPMHVVRIPDPAGVAAEGVLVSARAHSHTDYDIGTEAGHPVAQSLHLPVAQWTEASTSPGVFLAKASDPTGPDRRTTTSSYSLVVSGQYPGWTFRTPTQTTVTPAGQGSEITRTTVLDPASGMVTETRMPSDTGGTKVGTTATTYYGLGTSVNPNDCANTAWLNQVCRTGPKTQISPRPSGMADLPVTSTSYDWLLRPTTITQTVTDKDGNTQTRTSTTTYENSGWSPRPVSTDVDDTIAATPDVPPVTTTYASSTGLPLTVSGTGLGGALTTAYDDFGRPVSFTDADGATTATTYDSHGRPETTTETLSGATLRTTTLGYDGSLPGGGVEHRGLLTSSSTTGLGGAFTGLYDPDGALKTQTFPNGITATATLDETGDQRSLTYAKAGSTWFSDSQSSNIHGQWRWHDGLPSDQAYSYDGAGRLTNVVDRSVQSDGTLSCLSRSYTLDVDSNRTSLVTALPSGADPTCTAAGTGTVSNVFDDADRLTATNRATGLVYDAFGRITTLPAALTSVSGSGGSAVTNTFYVNDLIQQQVSNGVTKTWALDATAQRFRSFTDSGTGLTKINHYTSAGGDSPAWVDEGNGTHTRYATGLDGNLAATTTYTPATGVETAPVFQLSNLHGDLVTTATASAGTFDGAVLDNDEFGNPKQAASGRYGWLGGKQRGLDTLGGLTLMGVRLYTPTLGRFLSVDPVPGGTPNAYVYPDDPVNGFDLDGRKKCGRICKLSRKIREAISGVGFTAGANFGGLNGLCGASFKDGFSCSGGFGVGWGAAAGYGLTWQKRKTRGNSQTCGFMGRGRYGGGYCDDDYGTRVYQVSGGPGTPKNFYVSRNRTVSLNNWLKKLTRISF